MELKMNVIGAVVAGLIGTAVFSTVMWLGPRMGMPRMAIWELLGSMFAKDGNRAFGWIAHFMMGTIFAIIYAALWSAGGPRGLRLRGRVSLGGLGGIAPPLKRGGGRAARGLWPGLHPTGGIS